MAAATGLAGAFGAIFGEANPEGNPTAHPFLFSAHAHSALRVVATDCYSLAWERTLSVAELEDLRDDVGIGGSWSDFLDYLKSCLSSGEVKLLFAADQLGSDGAKLVATKAKGLPRITISLNRITGAAVNDVIADFSLGLYGIYRTMKENASREQERMSQLIGSLSSERSQIDDEVMDGRSTENVCTNPYGVQCIGRERPDILLLCWSWLQERNEIMQKQLEALSFLDRRKATKPKLVADQVPVVSGVTLGSDQVIAPVQLQTSVPSPSKVSQAKATKRAAPMSRRARVRGALLQDNEEDDDKN